MGLSRTERKEIKLEVLLHPCDSSAAQATPAPPPEAQLRLTCEWVTRAEEGKQRVQAGIVWFSFIA